MVVTAVGKESANARCPIERSFGGLIRHQLDGSDQADSTHFVYEWVCCEPPQPVLHSRRNLPDVRKNLSLFINFQSL